MLKKLKVYLEERIDMTVRSSFAGKIYADRNFKFSSESTIKNYSISYQLRDSSQDGETTVLIEQAKSETKADKESLKSLKKQWRTLSKADALDEQSLLEVANQQAALKAKLQVKRLQTEKAVQLVLNEEQQEKIAKWKKKKQRKARHHGGKDRA